MAQYIINTWNETSLKLEAQASKRQRPAAFLAYRRAVYDVLEAFAKRDTEAALKAMDVAMGQEDILSVGEERTILVSNTNRRVTISRRA